MGTKPDYLEQARTHLAAAYSKEYQGDIPVIVQGYTSLAIAAALIAIAETLHKDYRRRAVTDMGSAPVSSMSGVSDEYNKRSIIITVFNVEAEELDWDGIYASIVGSLVGLDKLLGVEMTLSLWEGESGHAG